MIFRNRAMAYVGASAAGLFAAGAFAAPAFAAGPDVAVDIVGTTIAANAEGKFAELELTNVGDAKPANIDIIFDVSKLDTSKVVFADKECGDPEDGKVFCTLFKEFIPAPGGSVDLGFLLERKEGAAGDAGEVTITVEADGDTNKENDSDTAKVGVGAKGVDLSVAAEDVRAPIDAAKSTQDPIFIDGPILPGGLTAVTAIVSNQGDMTAKGVKVSVTLPQHATFAEVEEGCTYSADNRTVTCDYKQFELIPADKDTVEDDDFRSGAGFWFPVKISETAKAPVSLTGGKVSAFALGAEDYKVASATASVNSAALPENVELLDAKDVEKVVDVDPTDNVDAYTIFVAAAGGSGGGGSLPVTGVQAGLIGGVGLGVVLVGGALFFIARRRRVVLVTPNDEKPTA